MDQYDHYLLTRWVAALLYDDLEDYHSLIAKLNEHLAKHPMNPFALNNRAIAHWESGQIDNALRDFGLAIEAAPREHTPLKHRGMFRENRGDLRGALQDYDLAVGLSPHDPRLLRTRAHARIKAGQLRGAVDDYSVAIARQPAFRQTYLDQADAFDQLGDKRRAQENRNLAKKPAWLLRLRSWFR